MDWTSGPDRNRSRAKTGYLFGSDRCRRFEKSQLLPVPLLTVGLKLALETGTHGSVGEAEGGKLLSPGRPRE